MTQSTLTKYYYSGRRVSKTQDEPLDAMKLLCHRLAFIYQRLSTHEQVQDHVFSIKMQDALIDMAKKDGFPDELIYVEKRDLGLSGTLGSDERPGLGHLISLIEQDRVEAVYVVHTSRLYRDQTLIDGFAFGELCKKHGVVIITPTMRLNLRNDMHMRVYRMELDWSAQELKMIKERMHGARDFKGRQGFYAGGQLAAGFILDTREGSPTFEKLIPYEPHAKVVRYIFQKTLEHQVALMQVVKDAKEDGVYFPFFTQGLDKVMNHRTGLKFTKKHSQGWIISTSLVRSIISNPIYIGWWVWKGEVISKTNHQPIIDEGLFWMVQDRVNSKSGRAWYVGRPMPLTGLLICGNHNSDDQERRPIRISSNRSHPRYECSNSYRNGVGDRMCLLVKDYILNIPICTFVVTQCSYQSYLDKVLKYLTDAHLQERERAEARKRELERLEAEIGNLKSHLAITKSQAQASIILEEIEKKLEEKRKKVREGETRQAQIAPSFSQANIEVVKEFLTNIGERWDLIPDAMKNKFLSSILDHVKILHDDVNMTAEIKWKTGLVQKLWIRRPYAPHHNAHGWTDQENDIMRKHYPDAPLEELAQFLPNRSWIAIKGQAIKLGLQRNDTDRTRKFPKRDWTEQDDKVVRQFYKGEMSIQEAASILGRSESAITFRGLQKLGLKKPKNAYNSRRTVEWGVLDDGFGGKTIEKIAEKLLEKNLLNTLGKFCLSSV